MREAAVDFFPRILIELLDAEADALIGLVDVENNGFEVVALFEHFARVVDLRVQQRSDTWIIPSMPSSSSTKAP
jgi:hypothetical protein